jgi:8-oxo-dGTP pyrophosphatase MutT (NUDIX family)
MPTPAYVLHLRRTLGHDLLLLPGLVAVVIDAQGRILLNRRADTGHWSLPSGILEPGEQPAAALEREVLEETGLTVKAARLLDAFTTPVITYPNGDQAQYLTVAYRCEILGGHLHIADDESLDLRFFAPDELPPLRPDLARCIELARTTP